MIDGRSAVVINRIKFFNFAKYAVSEKNLGFLQFMPFSLRRRLDKAFVLQNVKKNFKFLFCEFHSTTNARCSLNVM